MSRKNGTRYTKEFKEMVITRMMPSNNEANKSISEELGIFEQSLQSAP